MNVPEINRNAADHEDDGGLDPEAYEFISEEQRKEVEVETSLGLEGKVILVTGGNRGIGRRIVLLLEALGAKVAFTDRSDHKRDHGSLILHADVTYPGEMERAVETIEAELGPLYGVVANAGITRDGMFHKMTHRDWDAVMNVNLNGVYNTVRPAFPVMRDHGEGSIVLISSIIGVRGGLGQVNYAASKAGLIGLGKSLAAEGARKGVRTNIVAPGFVETDMTKVLPDNVQEAITSQIPIGRFGLPLEIAWPVAMLLSPTAGGYINGEVVNVNGGHLM
jgi:acetoacetyl-CoA reductase/3-oxoacyl-[acyl-carrier protein] reductase